MIRTCADSRTIQLRTIHAFGTLAISFLLAGFSPAGAQNDPDGGSDDGLELAAEWTRGEDRNTDRSLAGISPPQAIAALSYAPTPDLNLSLGIFNLTDKRHFAHANVINRPPDDPTLPLLAEPGTNFRGTLSWRFD